VPGAGLSADELLRMDQNLLKVSARKIERVRDEMLCPVCKKTSLRGRQQICSTKCRSASYRARLRASADPIPGVSRLRVESDRHTSPTDDRNVFEGSAPTTQMASSPHTMEPLFPLGSVAEPPAAYGLAEVDYSVPMEPPRIEQEVVPPISKAIPTTALSIRSTPTPLTEARQVAPRKSVRPLSNISALQTRIDAANASLIAASQNIGRPTRRKPLST